MRIGNYEVEPEYIEHAVQKAVTGGRSALTDDELHWLGVIGTSMNALTPAAETLQRLVIRCLGDTLGYTYEEAKAL